MQATAKFQGTQIVVTLSSENDAEKAIMNLVDASTPMFNLSKVDENAATTVAMVTALIELDKSKRG